MKLRFKSILHVLFFSLLIAASGGSVCGQGFVKTFGGPFIQVGYGVHELENGEIVVVAEEIWDPTVTYTEMVWYRLNSSGEVLSRKNNFGFGRSSPRKMLALSDDRYIVVGGSDNLNRQNARPYAAEFNANGDIQWQILLEHLHGDSSISPAGFVLDVDTVPGGGFLLTCHATSVFPEWIKRSHLVKLNDLGQIEWTTADSGLGWGIQGQSVIDDEGYIYTVLNSTPNFGDTIQFPLTKRDPNGTIIWTKIIRIDSKFKFGYLIDIEISNKGEIILGGGCFTDMRDYHGMLLKYSSDGIKIKENIFQIDGWSDTQIREISIAKSGDIIAIGEVSRDGDQQNPNGYVDGLFVHLGANLEVKETAFHSATTSSIDYFWALSPSGDHDYLMVGTASNLPGSTSTEVLLARVNCFGDTADPVISDQTIDLLAYPVPSSGMVTLSGESEELCLDRLTDLKIEIYNAVGQRVPVEWQIAEGKIVLNFSKKAPAHYYLVFRTKLGDFRNKKITISR
jgi:hypothetical protein